MKKIILLLVIASVCFSATTFSQESKPVSWFGELHVGWQATLNDRPLTAQIKEGYESKPFDSSKHYAAYFKNQIPVEISIGLNNHKGFQFQAGISYYQMKIALSNPPDVPGNEDYLFGNSNMLSLKTSAFIDYASLNTDAGSGRLHLMGGFSTGVIVPLSVKLDDATAAHFGISSFQKKIVWTAGIELLLNIDISRRIYIANASGFVFPIAGNMGKMMMQKNSIYSSGDPVKINALHISTGMGMRF